MSSTTPTSFLQNRSAAQFNTQWTLFPPGSSNSSNFSSTNVISPTNEQQDSAIEAFNDVLDLPAIKPRLFTGFVSDSSALDVRVGVWRIEWQQIKTLNNGPKICHHQLAFDDKQKIVYLFGGYRNGVGHLNEFWGFSIQTKQWWQLDPYGQIPTHRRGHSLTYHQNKLYVYGGFDGQNHSNELFIFDLSQNTWIKQEQTEYFQPPKVRGHNCCFVDDRFLLSFGGYNGEHYLNNILVYDVLGRCWTKLEVLGDGDNVPPAQAQHSIFFDGKRVIVIGSGEGGAGGCVYALENEQMRLGQKLKRDLQCSQKRLTEIIQREQDLKLQCLKYSQNRSHAEEISKELQEQVEALKQREKDIISDMMILEEKLQDERKIKRQKEVQVKDVNLQNFTLKQEMQQSKYQLKISRQQKERQESSHYELEQQLMSMGLRCRSLEQQLHEALNTQKMLNEENQMHQTELEKSKQKLFIQETLKNQANQDLEKHVNQKHDKLVEQQMKLEQQKQVLEDLEQEKENLIQECKNQKQEDEKLRQEIRNLQQQINYDIVQKSPKEKSYYGDSKNLLEGVQKEKQEAIYQLDCVTQKAQIEQQQMQKELQNLRQTIWILQSQLHQQSQQHQFFLESCKNGQKFFTDIDHQTEQQQSPQKNSQVNENFVKTKYFKNTMSIEMEKRLPEVQKLMNLQLGLISNGV